MNRSNYLYITGLAFKFGVLFFHKRVCLLLSMLLLTVSSKLYKFSFFLIIYVLLSTAGKNKANLEKSFKSFKKVQLHVKRSLIQTD